MAQPPLKFPVKVTKNSNRIKPFNLTYTTFNYQSSLKDKEFIDKIIVKGEELAKKVNPGAANNSNKSRKKERLINNASAGLLAEYCWKQYINKKANSKEFAF